MAALTRWSTSGAAQSPPMRIDLQLCAQAMCLEEMLCCSIPEGALFYGEPRRRDDGLLSAGAAAAGARHAADEMHQLYRQRPYAQGKAGQVLQCLLLEGSVPARADAVGAPCPSYLRKAVDELSHESICSTPCLSPREDIYLSLDGENVVANRDKQEAARYPLHTLSGIVSLFLLRRLPCADGGLRQAGRLPGLLHAPGPVPGPGHWRELRATCCCAGPSTGWRTTLAPLLPHCPQLWSSAKCTTPAGASSAPAGTTRSAWMTPALKLRHPASLRELLPQIGAETSLDSLRGLEGRRGYCLFRRVRSVDSGQNKPLFAFTSREPPPAAGPHQRAALLCVQSACPRLRLRSGERGTGRLCGLPATGTGRAAPPWRWI